jgi:hypothetical protein
MYFDILNTRISRWRFCSATGSRATLCALQFMMLVGFGWEKPLSAGMITVSFQATLNGGVIAHEAVRVSNDTFTNTIDYDTKPILAQFKMADGTGGRYDVHPDTSVINLDWNYMALDGAGAFTFNPAGTTTFSGMPFPIGTGTFASAGTNLPLAAHAGQLSTALQLPNGPTLAAGTALYSDLAGFHADYNNSANYWYDSATNIEHRTFTGGTWGFFYEDPSAAGSYLTLAEYHDVVFDFEISFRTGAVTTSWSGTPVAANGLILPGSVTGYGLTSPINTAGVLSNELTSPLTGFYGRFGDAFTMSFDVDNAQVVPEPSSLALFAIGGLGFIVLLGHHQIKRATDLKDEIVTNDLERILSD